MKRIHLKSEFSCNGHVYLDHVSTGKVYSTVSKDMQKTALELISQLKSGNCTCRKLQALYDRDAEFTVKCNPTHTLRDAKGLEKEFRMGKQPHLLLN